MCPLCGCKIKIRGDMLETLYRQRLLRNTRKVGASGGGGGVLV